MSDPTKYLNTKVRVQVDCTIVGIDLTHNGYILEVGNCLTPEGRPATIVIPMLQLDLLLKNIIIIEGSNG